MGRVSFGTLFREFDVSKQRVKTSIKGSGIYPAPFFLESKMKLSEFASTIAQREGKKSQVSIGNIREIVGIVADLMYESPNLQDLLLKLGQRRAKRRKK